VAFIWLTPKILRAIKRRFRFGGVGGVPASVGR